MASMRGIIAAVSILGLLWVASRRLDAQERLTRFEVGEQYTFFNQDYGAIENNLLGGRLDVHLSRGLWLTSQTDFGLTTYPPRRVEASRNTTSAYGGRLFMASFGLKAGKQKRRIGLFGEVRGGFVTWSGALTFVDYTNGINQFGRVTQPLLNFGGTLEIYASSRFGLRFNAGDSRIFYPGRSIVAGGPPEPAFARNNVHLSTGFFTRF